MEWNAKARDEILQRPNPPEHLFGEIEGFWSDSMRAKIKTLKDKNLIESVLKPLITSATVVGPRAWCYKHHDFCKDWACEIIYVKVMCSLLRKKRLLNTNPIKFEHVPLDQ